ncbi:hypothetical protein EBZ02_06835, partial [bacterium]|nr:hypothetical protein [bacterium]
MVRVADHGIFGIFARCGLTVVVSIKMVVAVQFVLLHPLDVAVFEEDEVETVRMVAALLAAVVRRIGHHGVMLAPQVGIRLEHAGSIT